MAAPSGAEPTASTFKEPEMSENTYGEDERPAATGMSAAAELMPKKPKSFKEAFAEARSAGDKTFSWQGKKYTTALATNKSAVSAKDLAEANKSSDPLGALVRAKRFTDVGSDEDQRSRGLNRAEPSKPAKPPTLSTSTSRGAGRGYKLSDVERPGTRVRYDNEDTSDMTYKRGGSVRGGGCEQRGKTKGRFV